jgi:hypothetical protein
MVETPRQGLHNVTPLLHMEAHEVTAELEAAAQQTGIGPGPGGVHRVGRVVQRRFFDPSQLGESKYRRA